MTDLLDGLELGHALAERAADHAGESWKDRAFAAFSHYAASNTCFTTEEVREAHEADVGAPPDPRAWGQVALRAKRAKIVRAIGVTRAKSARVHGMWVTQWKSNGS